MATALTKTAIDDAIAKAAAGERVELADSVVQGLRIRAGERGAKWSLLSRTPTGDRLRVPVGSWPAMKVSDARAKAIELRRQIEAGKNPNQTRKAARNAGSVADLLATYQTSKLDGLRTGKATRKSLDLVLRTLLKRDPLTLTRRDIADVIDKAAKTAPTHANRQLAYLRAFFGWAVGRGSMESNPAGAITKPLKEVARERTPDTGELVEIWKAAGELAYPFRHAIRLLIAIPARREEAIGIKLEELKLADGADEGEWIIPEAASKNGRAIRVPVLPLARSLLDEAIAARPDNAPLVFTTTGETPASGWSKVKARLDRHILETRRKADPEAKPMPPWRLHDFRRSFATIACENLGIDAAVADRCLNHTGAATSSTIQRVYGRSELFEQRREALRAWDDHLSRAIKGNAS